MPRFLAPRAARAAFALLVVAATRSRAQELEPRAYSPSPVGTNFALLVGSTTSGSVVSDASSPVQNIDAEIHGLTLAGGRTFALLGRLASLGVGVPYLRGDVSGDVFEQRREVHRSGLGDARVRFAWHLVGNPAESPAEFAKRKPATIFGTSLTILAPTGQYDPAKLVNIGGNRWAFKPELGVSKPLGKWNLELYAGAWFFETNDDYFGGTTRKQDPITAVQAHASYTFRPRLWVAANATFYRGGESEVGGVEKRDRQENTRLGLTASIPLRGQRSLKLAWTNGFVTRVGGDFETFAVGFQQVWFDRPRKP